MLEAGSPDFFDLAGRKLEWIDRRQQVLAGNVANADTPGYRSQDLAPFAVSIDSPAMPLIRTANGHLAAHEDGSAGTVRMSEGEMSPDGNDVALDQQMRLLAENEQDQGMVTSLLRRYVSMTDTALGVAG